MEQLRRYRWWILGGAIACLLLPTYVVLAQPFIAQTTPDFSWAKDLPPLLFLTVCAVVIIALLVYLFTRVFPKQEPKITVQSTNGAPDKEVTVNEMTGLTFSKFLEFMEKQDNKDSRQLDQYNRQFDQFSALVRAFSEDANKRQELLNIALAQLKDEIVQGRGNQMTAIIEVSDKLRDRMQEMGSVLATRNEQMERLNGGMGYLQLGQTKMQENLNSLLAETRKLTESIAAILTRIERIDATMTTVNDSEIVVKDELKELTTLVHSLDDRLNRISIAAGSAATPTIDPLALPDTPALPEKDDSHVE